jgi:hypothetical protein
MKNIFTMPDTVYVQLGDSPDFDCTKIGNEQESDEEEVQDSSEPFMYFICKGHYGVYFKNKTSPEA